MDISESIVGLRENDIKAVNNLWENIFSDLKNNSGGAYIFKGKTEDDLYRAVAQPNGNMGIFYNDSVNNVMNFFSYGKGSGFWVPLIENIKPKDAMQVFYDLAKDGPLFEKTIQIEKEDKPHETDNGKKKGYRVICDDGSSKIIQKENIKKKRDFER